MKKIKIILLTLISVFNIHLAKSFVFFKDITYETVLDSYSSTNEKSIKIIKAKALNYLKYLDDNNIKTLLHHSVLSEKADDFKILLFLLNANDFLEIRRYIYEKNQYLSFYNENKLTTHEIIARGLIGQGNEKDIDGNNFLHIAAQNNKFEIIKFTLTVLLDEIKNEKNQEIKDLLLKFMHKTNNNGETILHLAVRNGSRESIREILKYLKVYLKLTEDCVNFIFKKDNRNQTVFDLLLKSKPKLHVNSITITLLGWLILFYSDDHLIKKLAIKLIKTHPKKKDNLIELFKIASTKIFTSEIKKQHLWIQQKIDQLIQTMNSIDIKKILFDIEQPHKETQLKIKIPLHPHEQYLEGPSLPLQTPRTN